MWREEGRWENAEEAFPRRPPPLAPASPMSRSAARFRDGSFLPAFPFFSHGSGEGTAAKKSCSVGRASDISPRVLFSLPPPPKRKLPGLEDSPSPPKSPFLLFFSSSHGKAGGGRECQRRKEEGKGRKKEAALSLPFLHLFLPSSFPSFVAVVWRRREPPSYNRRPSVSPSNVLGLAPRSPGRGIPAHRIIYKITKLSNALSPVTTHNTSYLFIQQDRRYLTSPPRRSTGFPSFRTYIAAVLARTITAHPLSDDDDGDDGDALPPLFCRRQ